MLAICVLEMPIVPSVNWPKNSNVSHVISKAYCLDVIFEGTRDGLRVLGVLLGDDGEVADLISVVGLQIFQRLLEVSGHFSRS